MSFLRDPVTFISTLIQKWLTPLDLPAILSRSDRPHTGCSRFAAAGHAVGDLFDLV